FLITLVGRPTLLLSLGCPSLRRLSIGRGRELLHVVRRRIAGLGNGGGTVTVPHLLVLVVDVDQHGVEHILVRDTCLAGDCLKELALWQALQATVLPRVERLCGRAHAARERGVSNAVLVEVRLDQVPQVAHAVNPSPGERAWSTGVSTMPSTRQRAASARCRLPTTPRNPAA